MHADAVVAALALALARQATSATSRNSLLCVVRREAGVRPRNQMVTDRCGQ
jgi:hypothetical protein